jgi:hypothetical protein
LDQGGKVHFDRCILEHNDSSGVVCAAEGKLIVENCLVHSNGMNGIGAHGNGTELIVKNSHIFQHRLNGIETHADIQSMTVTDNVICKNLNGVKIFVNDATKVSSLQEDILSGNSMRENRREDVKIIPIEGGKSLADMAIEENVCTFLYTGGHFVNQDFYHCYTCKLDNRIGCCGKYASSYSFSL